MNKIAALILMITCAISLNASINLTLDYASFNLVDQKPYLELYLNINGNSILYANTEEDFYQAKVEITYLIEKGDEVIAFEKFQINSPIYNAEDDKLDLIDLRRIVVENGEYELTLIAKDLILKSKTEVKQQLRVVNYPTNTIAFSDIQLANQVIAANDKNGQFAKNGYDIIPNISHVYKAEQSSMHFYTELYHSDKLLGEQEDFLIEYTVIDQESNEVAANIRGIKRSKSNPVIPLLFAIDIANLPSGKYHLKIEAKNRNNEQIASNQIEFYRINPKLVNYSSINANGTFVDSITNVHEMEAYIKCLRPISSTDELTFAENQLEYGDLTFMQQYFLNFWRTRNLADPESDWLKYKSDVAFVNQEFGYGSIQGYNTERGRVYLQYGPPTAVQDMPYERDTYPYSIWQYAKLNGMTNRRFVFYSPSMEMLGYEVLHSNVIGEIQNPNWELDLISKTNGNKGTREIPQGTIINSPANDLYNNPR